MSRIFEIVDRAIDIAKIAKERGPDNFDVAEKSLKKLADELRVNDQNHPALKKLEEYLDQIRPK